MSTRRNDSTTFKRCMQIPSKSKAQFGLLSHRQVLRATFRLGEIRHYRERASLGVQLTELTARLLS